MRRLLVALLLVACAAAGTPAAAQTVLTGNTAGGAFYRIVLPDGWNGDLVIWNHGFDLDPIGPVDEFGPVEDVVLLEGFALAASSYRQTGWAVFKSNQDLRALVNVFRGNVGEPERIFLIGASLGGAVTGKAIESGDLGNVVGAFTACGAMAGARNWDGAIDLRLIYDTVCSDVPRAAIPGGGKGLPRDSDFSEADLEAAVNACTGVSLRRGQRSTAQQARLERILELTGLPESFLLTDMGFATFGLADLIHSRDKLKGKQGVGNRGVDYGDARINRSIERVKARRRIARKLERSYTPSGRVGDVKIVSLHTDKDGLVLVENQREYADVVPSRNLVTLIVVEDEPSHCGFSTLEALVAWEALLAWVDSGVRPSAEIVQDTCETFEPLLGGPCRIDPDFRVPKMDRRIRPR
jgi:hypothetical protein